MGMVYTTAVNCLVAGGLVWRGIKVLEDAGMVGRFFCSPATPLVQAITSPGIFTFVKMLVPTLLSIVGSAAGASVIGRSPSITFQENIQAEAGGMHNVHIEYAAPLDGELSLHYGSCNDLSMVCQSVSPDLEGGPSNATLRSFRMPQMLPFCS